MLSLHNLLCMYVLWNYLWLLNTSCCVLSLERHIRFLSAFLSNLYFFVYSCELSVFSHLLWKVLFCCYTHVWTLVLVRLCGCSIWYYLEIKSHRKLYDPHPLTIFPPLLCNVPWMLHAWEICKHIHWIYAPKLCIFVSCYFL